MKDSYLFYKEKLTGDYKTAFDQVEIYVNAQNIDELTCEDRLGSLLDMLLSAQEAGRPVQKVIGSSIEQFCKAFCSDMGTRNRVWHFLDTLKTIAFIELMCAVIDLWSADWTGTDFRSLLSTTNASGLVFGFAACALIGYITNFVVQRLMFKTKKLNMNLLKCIVFFMTGVTFAAVFGILSADQLNFFPCPLWAVMGVSAIYLVIYYIFNHKRTAENKLPKVKFSDLVAQQTTLNLDSFMEKRYQTLNKRSIKKGRGALSMRDFLDNEEKECDKSDSLGWLFYGTPIVLTGLGLLTTEFDTTFDMVLYLVLMLGIYFLFMHFSFKSTKKTTAQKRAWIIAKRNALDQ
jgi:DNA-binding ferritin-like protein (Dps family)